jgi:lactoylglutathione lyase
MRLEHVAIWAVDIELMRTFYEKYFDARSNRKYENGRKKFTSYFLTFPGGGRLELMRDQTSTDCRSLSPHEFIGYAHPGVGWARGPRRRPHQTTAGDGLPLLDGPRQTGDGYYESIPSRRRIVIADKSAAGLISGSA